MTSVCIHCRKEYDLPGAQVCPDDGEPLLPVLETYTGEESAIRGRVLDGRYRIEELLGEGGMGLVLRARHLFLDRPVAIKLLHPELLLVDEVKARFLREARTASAVRHERVVEINDFGVTSQGLHYLVMEYLSGEDLFDWSRARDRVNVRDVLRIGIQTCEALAVIHRHGFVHRDLKPENLWLVDRDPGQVKLLDFGIAGVLAAGETPDADRLTRTGRALGTPTYMAPEQARAATLDGRADLYALACVLWELATGQPTFAGGSPMEVMTRQLQQAPRAPSELVPTLPWWFDDLILRALEKDPEDRYADAEEMGEALRRGLERLDSGAGEGAPTPARDAPPARSVTPLERPAAPRATQERPLTEAEALPSPTPPEPEEPEQRRVARWLVPLVAVLLLGGAFLLLRQGGGDTGGTPPDEGASEAVATPAERSGEPVVRTPAEPAPAPTADASGADAATQERPARTVVLQFRVTPEGSEVLRGDQVLGRTPLALPVDRSEEVVAYTFRHEGREPLTLRVPHDRARTLDAALTKPAVEQEAEPEAEAERPSPRRRRPAPAPDKEGETGSTELMRPELPLDEGGP